MISVHFLAGKKKVVCKMFRLAVVPTQPPFFSIDNAGSFYAGKTAGSCDQTTQRI